MRQTKGAIGNLLNRYKAVLKKCNLLNTFGSLAVASMLVMGGAGIVQANTPSDMAMLLRTLRIALNTMAQMGPQTLTKQRQVP